MKKVLPYLTALAALTLAATAAFYSISGLSKFYAGAASAVIIMGCAIEAGKLIATSILHQYHKILKWPIKIYLTLAIIISMAITSAGIYGFLVSAYQETAYKMEMEDGVIQAEQNKMIIYQQELKNIETQQLSLDKNISETNDQILQLSHGLGNNVVQYTDANGNVITTQSSSTRKLLQEQLNNQTVYRDTLVAKRDRLNIKFQAANDSIAAMEIKILQIKTNSDIAGEVGPLRYISDVTGKPMASVVNWFTLLLILIFDPLAVALVIVLNNLTGKGAKPEESKAKRVKAPTPAPKPVIKMSVPEGKEFNVPYPIPDEIINKEDTKPETSSSMDTDIYEEKKELPKKPKRRAYWTK